MTRPALAIFNLLDASPSNVPVLLEEAVSENGEKNRPKRHVITLYGRSLPHPLIASVPLEIMKWIFILLVVTKATIYSLALGVCTVTEHKQSQETDVGGELNLIRASEKPVCVSLCGKPSQSSSL